MAQQEQQLGLLLVVLAALARTGSANCIPDSNNSTSLGRRCESDADCFGDASECYERHCRVPVKSENPKQNNSFTSLPNPSMAKTASAAAALDGFAYVMGGSSGPPGQVQVHDTIERYDPRSQQWQAMAPMIATATCATGRRTAHAAVAFDGSIYVIGGFRHETHREGCSSVIRYSPTDNRWEASVALPGARYHHSAEVIGECMYVVGGTLYVPPPGNFYPEFRSGLKYCKSNPVWIDIADLGTGHSGHESAVIGTKLYVCGGCIAHGWGVAKASCEVYDSTADQWTDIAPLAIYSSAMVAIDGLLYVFGGYSGTVAMVDNNTDIRDEVQQYNPAVGALDRKIWIVN